VIVIWNEVTIILKHRLASSLAELKQKEESLTKATLVSLLVIYFIPLMLNLLLGITSVEKADDYSRP